ncbi:MAG: long-chain fatty acid--CoA ligase [Candidatus Eremiobacteraeota bacterium]|nr:long-chain fatty acid--CoA ligase [Candidatus Eremiobacteraeota bacterium]MBC5827747.1 long-chain fatty acid--CoA ligase [Candidatus Eremiobacteraeota bacterium]
MDRITADLDARIRRFIGRKDPTELGFERLALDVFAHQYECNRPYRHHCDRVLRDPSAVRSWRDVPAVSAASFADARLACFPPKRTALTFVSSGTTSAGARPSHHELETPAIYDASLLTHFQARAMPDCASGTLFALVPPFTDAPQSSLAYMISKIAAVFGTGEGGHFVNREGLDFDGFAAALERCSEPAVLFGTALAFAEVILRFDAAGRRFRLPIGTRIVETGGFKGVAREIPRAQLYEGFGRVFGVARVLCLSEYGMCELASQWYDANLDDYFAGRRPRIDVKVGPHWARVVVVDPVTGRPVPSGDPGLLQFFDLANRGSVSAVLTADVGRECEGGIELIGRSSAQPPKGCSIAADALLHKLDG